ncbi:zinc finger protein draculin-like [Chironomus tepperi]|uniref:zinc finger protein draculin-like n=1 Tax=Chironomus tepperi TaxID=113505 RepID=UPI00391EFB66
MNICRVCLHEGKTEVVAIYETINCRTVAGMVNFCSGIEVSSQDCLPQTVCSQCLESLILACNIKELCINSDKILKQQIESIKDKVVPNFEIKSEAHLDSDSNIQNDDRISNSNFESSSRNQEDRLFLSESKARSSSLEQNDSVQPDSKATPTKKSKTRQSKHKSREPQLPFKCYLCDMEFRYRKEKYEHLEVFHTTDELKCKLCKHKSQTARGLDNHIMVHENPDLLFHMCHICGKKNYQKACELRRHIKLAHGDKTKRLINFYCDNCDFKTFSKMNMKRHLSTIHLKIKAFGCHLCPDKKYTSKITLDQHMISKHGQETDFICQCCKRKFPTMSFLRSHLKSTCSGSPGSVRERGDPNEYREPLYDELDHYRCKLCGLVFEGKGKIAQHYAQRHKHNNSCDLCSATFNSYSNLKKHIQILHNKIHKYSCSYCSRSFGQKNQLQSHINTHTGDKPFQCKFDFCSFRSGDLSAVSKHQKKCENNPVNKI